MSRPVKIMIDRLVLPAGERGREAQFRAAFESQLAAELAGRAAPVPDGDTAARAASAVASKVRGAQS
jgi:hypothetical protein